MHYPTATALLLAFALYAHGDSFAAPPAAPPANTDSPKPTGKAGPSCMHCGGTCGLESVCVCKPGTKKRPKTEYSTTCEPICLAGCSREPWRFGQCDERAGCTAGCTAGCDEPGVCGGRIRNRRTLHTDTIDEEVPTVERKVAFVCRQCAEGCPQSCSEEGPANSCESWWSSLTSRWRLW